MIYFKTTIEQLGEDDETALDAAIADAAGLEHNEKYLAVKSIQVDVNLNNSKMQDQENIHEGGELHQESSEAPVNISALLISERKCSGTESVQINEKLINREN